MIPAHFRLLCSYHPIHSTIINVPPGFQYPPDFLKALHWPRPENGPFQRQWLHQMSLLQREDEIHPLHNVTSPNLYLMPVELLLFYHKTTLGIVQRCLTVAAGNRSKALRYCVLHHIRNLRPWNAPPPVYLENRKVPNRKQRHALDSYRWPSISPSTVRLSGVVKKLFENPHGITDPFFLYYHEFRAVWISPWFLNKAKPGQAL